MFFYFFVGSFCMEMVSVFLACVAGACFALQAAVNGALRGTLHDGRYAAFFSICGTIITAAIFILCVQPPLPALAVMRSAPWWNWIGGPLGALIVLAGATLAPRIGAAAFIASLVAGQLFCSLLLDHYGLMNLPQQSITAGRLMGAALVFVGVVLVKYS